MKGCRVLVKFTNMFVYEKLQTVRKLNVNLIIFLFHKTRNCFDFETIRTLSIYRR